jgi:hypothetical protein
VTQQLGLPLDEPRPLSLPGAALEGIHHLRRPDEAPKLGARIQCTGAIGRDRKTSDTSHGVGSSVEALAEPGGVRS